MVLALSVWLGALLLGPVIFRYGVGYSASADLFVAACLVATTTGYLLVRQQPREAPTDHEHMPAEIGLAHLLGLAGILGCVLLLADARAQGIPLSLGYLLDNLGSLRQRQFEGLATSAEQTQTRVIGSYLASCSFLVVLAASRVGQVGYLRSLAVANFALIAAVSLLVYQGRATVFNLALLLLVSAYLLRRRLLPRKPRAVAVAMIAVVAVWYFSVPYLATRERAADPIAVLEDTQRAQLHSGIEPLARKDPAFGLAMVSVGYFTSPFATLSYYMQVGPPPGPLWGGYSYPLPARTIAKLQGTATPDLWLKDREQAFMPLASAGYFPNVWATWLRDLLVDFGHLGAILFSVGFGAFMAWARNGFERKGTLYHHYYQTIACFTFTFGAFTSLLWNGFLANAFFITIALAFGVHTGLFSRLLPHAAVPAASRETAPFDQTGLLKVMS